MPLFEFTCTACGRNFEELVRSSSQVTLVTCPVCQSDQVKKKVSTFASKVSGGSLSFAPAASSSTTAAPASSR